MQHGNSMQGKVRSKNKAVRGTKVDESHDNTIQTYLYCVQVFRKRTE